MPAHPARVTIKVAVQSPRRLLRDALSACMSIRPDLTVVGKVAEPGDLLDLCDLARPDVVILDAGDRLRDYAVLAGRLTRRLPELNLIVTYRDADEQDLAAACRSGVTSLVPESHGLAALLALLQRRPGRHARHTAGGLTDRELELVVLTGSGHSVSEIAALLRISPVTVENLKRRVYAKMGVNSSAHAASRAASLGMLDHRPAPAAPRSAPSDSEFAVLTVVCGQQSWASDEVTQLLVASRLPFVFIREPAPAADPPVPDAPVPDTPLSRAPLSDAHWARWHRGPIVAALVDPSPTDWDLVDELSVPAILVHSKPLDPAELAEALARGASALVSGDKIADHFRSVLTMVGQGYLVVDSRPMRLLIGAARARWDQRAPGAGDLPELTARETDILRSAALGHSIRRTATVLGIAPKTVENIQTRLFRKLGVRNRSGALAVADAFGLLPESPPQPAAARSQPDQPALLTTRH
jgi:DNA-binding NarL/FixJ family response regulator